jgi:hypothetical protein
MRIRHFIVPVRCSQCGENSEEFAEFEDVVAAVPSRCHFNAENG